MIAISIALGVAALVSAVAVWVHVVIRIFRRQPQPGDSSRAWKVTFLLAAAIDLAAALVFALGIRTNSEVPHLEALAVTGFALGAALLNLGRSEAGPCLPSPEY